MIRSDVKPLVLVVDDDPMMRIMVDRFMEHDGYQVIEATNGEECLQLYKETSPDLILLDAMMPIMNGIETCKQLRQLPGGDTIPILIVTALDDEKTVEAVFEAGADDYVQKPINWAVLRQRVCHQLRTRRAEEVLRDSEERLRTVVANVPVILFAVDNQGIITLSEGKGLGALGRKPGETVGQSLVDVYHEWPEIIDNVHYAREGMTFNTILTLNNGIFDTYYAPHKDKNGNVIGVIGVAADVTERQRWETIQRDRNRVIEMVAKNQPLRETLTELSYLLERNQTDIVCSFVLQKQGQTYATVAPNLPQEFTQFLNAHPELYPKNDAALETDYLLHDFCWMAYRQAAATHHIYPYRSIPIWDGNSHLLGMLMIHGYEASWTQTSQLPVDDPSLVKMVTDVAAIAIEQHHMTEQLAYQANHDPLTGLPNRLAFEVRLEQAISQAHRGGKQLALLFIDLDRFKVINDTLGHGIGDGLLKEVAHRLRACLGPNDIVARMGGDEFAMLLGDVGTSNDAVCTAQAVLECLKVPCVIDGYELRVTGSVGISFYPIHGHSSEELLSKADVALYESKDHGRNTYFLYDTQVNVSDLGSVKLENSLAYALERNEFQLYYQPQFDLETDQLIGMEALLRWKHPELGIIPPTKFIPIAEASGLIIPIGGWVLKEACRQTQVWRKMGYELFTSVNVSILQFRRDDFLDAVISALEHAQLNPQCLELELTETMLMRHTQMTTQKFAEFKRLGVRIAIDDFGTGYSSLNYLQQLPINTLKIDRSFVRSIGDDPQWTAKGKTIIKAITTMAHALGMSVVAEGVETEQQLDVLRNLDCDGLQGYLFSKPLPADEFETLLASKSTRAILHGFYS